MVLFLKEKKLDDIIKEEKLRPWDNWNNYDKQDITMTLRQMTV